jgi:hypothetical protein
MTWTLETILGFHYSKKGTRQGIPHNIDKHRISKSRSELLSLTRHPHGYMLAATMDDWGFKSPHLLLHFPLKCSHPSIPLQLK